jgi:ParB-like chromosome segregation protein Spo0J
VARPAFGPAGHAAASYVLGSPATTLTDSLPYLFVIDLLNWLIAIHRSLYMPNNATTKRLERRKLADLKPHPRQAGLFHDAHHDPEDKDLAEDMRLNGLQCPVEALPDGTVVCGHRRTRAARSLGWDEIDVWVRDDLVDRPEAAELRLIEDNLNRRHLGPLELARCYRRLKELAQGTPRAELRECQQGDVRDVIAQRLGGSGRNLDRYLKVLGAPPAVQRAVEAKELSLQDGGAVAFLPKQTQEDIARRIEAGEKPKDVVKGVLPEKAAVHYSAHAAHQAFCRSLEAALNDLGGRVGELGYITARQVGLYRAAHEMIGRILERADAIGGPTEAREPRLVDLLEGFESAAG